MEASSLLSHTHHGCAYHGLCCLPCRACSSRKRTYRSRSPTGEQQGKQLMFDAYCSSDRGQDNPAAHYNSVTCTMLKGRAIAAPPSFCSGKALPLGQLGHSSDPIRCTWQLPYILYQAALCVACASCGALYLLVPPTDGVVHQAGGTHKQRWCTDKLPCYSQWVKINVVACASGSLASTDTDPQQKILGQFPRDACCSRQPRPHGTCGLLRTHTVHTEPALDPQTTLQSGRCSSVCLILCCASCIKTLHQCCCASHY